MIEQDFAGWRVEHDRDSTVRALERAGYEGPEECGCTNCRNFIVLRDEAYPPLPVAQLDFWCELPWVIEQEQPL